MKVSIEVTGYKKVRDNLYYLSCLASETVNGTEGLATYNGFINQKYLDTLGLTENDLIDRKGTYYNIKKDDGKYKEVLSLSERM